MCTLGKYSKLSEHSLSLPVPHPPNPVYNETLMLFFCVYTPSCMMEKSVGMENVFNVYSHPSLFLSSKKGFVIRRIERSIQHIYIVCCYVFYETNEREMLNTFSSDNALRCVLEWVEW